jgi:hypothetical protein
MGFKTIEAKRQEYSKLVETKQQFRDAIAQMNGLVEQVNQLHERHFQGCQELAKRLALLNTGGVKEFEQYKAHLVDGAQKGGQIRPLPMGPLDKALEESEKEIDNLVLQHALKLAKNCPSTLQPGMTFYDGGNFYFDVKSGPINDPKKKGDDAILYKLVCYNKAGKVAGEPQHPLSSIKKWKYIQTN